MMATTKFFRLSLPLITCTLLAPGLSTGGAQEVELPKFRKTSVSIVGDEFWINGKPTYEGRTWKGHKIQGLLLNSRMVQGVFDDRNPETVKKWAYPDTAQWDAWRNTTEFVAAMPQWKQHGLLAFTLNLQGGQPIRHTTEQPWHNSAIEPDGSLNTNYMQRLEHILERADELGMVVILGYFYFGQDQRLKDEAAVIKATDNATQWLFDRGYRNVLIEINNECNIQYDHAILKPDRVHELISRVRDTTRSHRRFYVGTSYGGGTLPDPGVVRLSDFLLMHGNGVSDPKRIAEMVQTVRKAPGYLLPKPILFNEDDHFDFDRPTNNFVAAVGAYASWGFFDPGTNNFVDGFQSPPVNWGINTERKRSFFQLLAEITGSVFVAQKPTVAVAPTLVSKGPVTILRGEYHGWTNSYFMSNGLVQVVVVPAVGRVMQFGFTGEDGVFWENCQLDGQMGNWEKGWINFGGDKTWPSPEADWSKHTHRDNWCPPPAFDGLPAAVTVEGSDIILTSPVDPYYAVKAQRRIRLDPVRPVMTISTTYDRTKGEPAQVGVWVITQLKDPVRVYAPLPPKPSMPDKYVLLSKEKPQDLRIEQGLLSLPRNPATAYKIGTEAGTLVWVGEKHALRIDCARVPNVLYPDQRSSTEIYTSPDPLKYVELETLGPLHMMKGGDRIERANTYTLSRRSEKNPDAEARKLLQP